MFDVMITFVFLKSTVRAARPAPTWTLTVYVHRALIVWLSSLLSSCTPEHPLSRSEPGRTRDLTLSQAPHGGSRSPGVETPGVACQETA